MALVAVAATGAALAIFASPSDSTQASSLSVFPAPGSGARWVVGPSVDIPRFHTQSSGDTRAIGSVLLIVSLAGIVLVTLSSLGVAPRSWSRGSAA